MIHRQRDTPGVWMRARDFDTRTKDILKRHLQGDTVFETAADLGLPVREVQRILHKGFVRIVNAGYWQNFIDGEII